MAQLPVVGGDTDVWGNELNTFLLVAHRSDGKLKNVYNVMDYGAVGDGVTDDTVSCQNAATAAKAAGGNLFFPPGKFLVSASLLVGGGSPGAMTISGAGWSSQLFLKNASNCYIFDFGSAGSPQYTNGLTIRDLYLNCNGANQTATSGGIFARGSVWGQFAHLWIDKPQDTAIRTDGDGTGSYGHHNLIIGNLITSTGGPIAGQKGIYLYKSDENMVAFNTFQGIGAQTDSYPEAVQDQSGIQTIIGNQFVTGTGCYVGSSGSRSRIIGNMFDGCQSGAGQLYLGSTGSIASGNYFYNIGAGQDGVTVDNTDHISLIDNVFQTATNTAARSAINLWGSPTNFRFRGNMFLTDGTGSYTAAGAVNGNLSGMTGVLADNVPYNPVGVLAAPAIPVSGTALTNSFCVNATVYISGGTVTAIAVNGTTTGLTSGAVRVPAGKTLTLTYSVAPTWVWMGD